MHYFNAYRNSCGKEIRYERVMKNQGNAARYPRGPGYPLQARSCTPANACGLSIAIPIAGVDVRS